MRAQCKNIASPIRTKETTTKETVVHVFEPWLHKHTFIYKLLVLSSDIFLTLDEWEIGSSFWLAYGLYLQVWLEVPIVCLVIFLCLLAIYPWSPHLHDTHTHIHTILGHTKPNHTLPNHTFTLQCTAPHYSRVHYSTLYWTTLDYITLPPYLRTVLNHSVSWRILP